MTLLTMVRRTCALVSLKQPPSVVNSTEVQVQQMFALANEEGEELASSYDWQKLTKQYEFTLDATPEQPNAFPDDFDYFLPNTQFNRSTLRQMFGPITPQRWQAIQVYPQFVGIYLAFRLRDGNFLITPTPPAGETIAYEYKTKNWALSSTGDAKSEFTADDDTTVLSETLMWRGLRWRWKAAKGLDYAEDMKTYESQKAQAQARDGGSTAINSGGDPYWNWRANVPDGNFPG